MIASLKTYSGSTLAHVTPKLAYIKNIAGLNIILRNKGKKWKIIGTWLLEYELFRKTNITEEDHVLSKKEL